jgi:hypothetical protein
MVASLHNWVENVLQPAAREALGTPVARLRNVSGYVCRARNGNPLGSDKISQHALANAIDIAGFVTADGRTVDVARGWGLTERDRREATKAAAAKEKDARKGATEARREAEPERMLGVRSSTKVSLIAPPAEVPPRSGAATAKPRAKTASLGRAGRSVSDVSMDPNALPTAATAAEEEDPKKRAEAQFLRRLHKGACGVFGTVLGPEANDLHRDHFHFDLAERRHSAFCQ